MKLHTTCLLSPYHGMLECVLPPLHTDPQDTMWLTHSGTVWCSFSFLMHSLLHKQAKLRKLTQTVFLYLGKCLQVSLVVIMCVMDKEDKCLVFSSSFTSQGGFSLKCCPLHFFSLQASPPFSLIQAGRSCLALWPCSAFPCSPSSPWAHAAGWWSAGQNSRSGRRTNRGNQEELL